MVDHDRLMAYTSTEYDHAHNEAGIVRRALFCEQDVALASQRGVMPSCWRGAGRVAQRSWTRKLH